MSNKKNIEIKKVGTNTKYKSDFPERAYEFLIQGKTMVQLAEYLRVSLSSVYLYIDIHSEFSEAIKRGREKADDLVEESVFEAATGRVCVEEEVTYLHQATGEIKSKIVKRYFPPNPAMAKMWLANRRPGQWTEKKEIEHSGEIKGLKIGFSDIEEDKEEGETE